MFDLNRLQGISKLDTDIARYISTHLDKVAFMRVRELADATHVSPATIVRFTKKMGYDSFPEMKVAIKQELTSYKEMPSEIVSKERLVSPDIFAEDYQEQLDRLVVKLQSADLIQCLGIGSSGIMAEYAAKLLTNIGYRAFVSTSPYIPYLNMDQKVRNAKEVALFFSVSGETQEIVYLAQLLEASTIFTASITNQGGNSLAQLTDINIAYESAYHRLDFNADISSQLPVVYIIELIVQKLYQLK